MKVFTLRAVKLKAGYNAVELVEVRKTAGNRLGYIYSTSLGQVMAKESTSTNGGVHVTTEMLMHASKTTLAKGESTEHYLHRITHLTLNNKKLTSMTNLHRCTNVKVVLYMYDNKIASIDATLSSLRHLTHVHLQRNRISKIEHFDALVHLEKLCGLVTAVYGLVGNLRRLKDLNLTNNHVNATPKYRDNTIIFSHASLGTARAERGPLLCLSCR
ncbi:hypothetical protein DYB32_007106 [Aphanomyces invadans]|uniref:Uncharacterized protein n=1 Tax=Aphanomyces invadans TaxID=157072 RepID=A0A3R6Y565_9STRA|nr:hypothetical protein DYB32_007106 [Aphanomyces invadans]